MSLFTIWIDADSCPSLVRNHAIKMSNKYNLKIILVANKKIHCDTIFPYEMQICSKQKDAADDFILENVKGLVTHDKGQTVKLILNELGNSGFDVIYKVLTSLDYGVPQMRQRVYFIGINKNLNMNIELFKWPQTVEKPSLKKYLIDNNKANNKRLEILQYYLNNPTNNGKYTISDLEQMEGKILDTRMSDLRIYEERCPTLRSQRDGILYVRNGEIYQLTGYEALLLQGFPKEYADKVKDTVSDRHLLMQAGNAMTVNVINALGNSLIEFFKDV